MLFSLLLVATTVGLAFLLRALSDDLDVTRADPGTSAEVQSHPDVVAAYLGG